jgi:hypothetical protein
VLEGEGKTAYELYPQRWIQLAYLAILAFLSDWVCFSVAAAPGVWESTYAHDPATLIDVRAHGPHRAWLLGGCG